MSRRARAADVVVDDAPRLADHPRAATSIVRTKAAAGLIGLVVGLLIALRSGLALDAALVRGLATGVAGYLAGWLLAVVIWTQLARGELEAHRARVLAAHDDARA